MLKAFNRLSLGAQFGLLLVALVAFIVAAGSIVGRSIVESQVLNEGRSIADMTEHIGRWASQYGGVHIKTTPKSTVSIGSYLERAVYAADAGDQDILVGARMNSAAQHLSAFQRVESYHWKNPALIQREVSDIAAGSRSKVKFRITAATVLNPHNSPDEFERQAIEAINARLVQNDGGGNPTATLRQQAPAEYWGVQGGQMRYARAIIAAPSCLKCHESREKAPAFLTTNAEFNGGGGFGYEAGRPAGIISVRVPIPAASVAIASSLTLPGWAALATILLVSVLILVFVVHNVIRPVNLLRDYADALAGSAVGQDFEVPDFAKGEERSANEVHRLGGAIGELGQSIQILFRKLRDARK